MLATAMPALRIDVETASRAYPVHVGEGLTDRLGDLLDEVGATGRRFLVSSPTVWRAHGRAIEGALPGALVILVPDGERSKTTRTVARIYEELLLAAATILRGVALVQVPTTLLAQVDAAVGGKVGVNHALGKNLIGAFHQPLAVIADPRLLRTLPRREFRAGLYEVIKYGVIADPDLFERVDRDLDAIFAREPEALVPVIAASCRIKADIVSKDEREGGLRRLLNFGHTAGHAIEAVTRYRRFRHGEAVGYGMLAAADLAVRRGALDGADRDALGALIARLGPLPSVRDLSVADVVQATRRDKKVLRGTLHVILPTRIGATEIVNDVTEAELAHALRAIGMRS
ncbi:MAG: 3-dehydroquinate synthase [Acidobacteria bacterium]|nr:3-dehydroquinate synthase [Acidobacteriota bacterium]